MNREAFLERVRAAAKAGAKYRVSVDPASATAGYVGVEGDICRQLAAEVTGVGGEAHLCESWIEARQTVALLLQKYSTKSIIRWKHAALDKLGLTELLSHHGIAESDYDQLAAQPPDRRRSLILAADVGVSSVDYAIAETGTLAVCAKPGQERVVSLLPPVHIAVLERSQILPDLFDLFTQFGQWNPESWPSNVALITGPSKTGDIELELTTGVHGPGHWHVVIVRD